MSGLIALAALILGGGIVLKVICGQSPGAATKETLGRFASTTGKLGKVAGKAAWRMRR